MGTREAPGNLETTAHETYEVARTAREGYMLQFAVLDVPVLWFGGGRGVAYVNLCGSTTNGLLNSLCRSLDGIVPDTSVLKFYSCRHGRKGREFYNLGTHQGELPCAYIAQLQSWLQAVISAQDEAPGAALEAMLAGLSLGRRRPSKRGEMAPPFNTNIAVTLTGVQYLVGRASKGKEVQRQEIHKDQDQEQHECCVMVGARCGNLGTLLVDPCGGDNSNPKHADTAAFAFDTCALHAGPAQQALDERNYGCGRFAFHFLPAGVDEAYAEGYQERNGCKADRLVQLLFKRRRSRASVPLEA